MVGFVLIGPATRHGDSPEASLLLDSANSRIKNPVCEMSEEGEMRNQTAGLV